jgi:hypothetical protein
MINKTEFEKYQFFFLLRGTNPHYNSSDMDAELTAIEQNWRNTK